jgi:glycosyltransferase involved in cell wall biosynthesis
MAELISVIVAIYNRADALDAVLRSLARQTDRNFEVVLADDGSTDETGAVTEVWRAKLGCRLDRVWQEHRGFRAAESRNRAILAARGSYFIFLDGDCIVRPDFIARHRRLAEPGWFVTGNRILLSADLTERVLRDRLTPETWRIGDWLPERRHGGVNRLLPLMHLPLGPLRRLRSREWRDARGCNLAVWRADIDRVDGFDAEYSAWGPEDSDLMVRMMHAGLRRKEGTFATGVLHLWHPPADRSMLPALDRKLSDLIDTDRIRAQRGLSALRAAASPVPAS